MIAKLCVYATQPITVELWVLVAMGLGCVLGMAAFALWRGDAG